MSKIGTVFRLLAAGDLGMLRRRLRILLRARRLNRVGGRPFRYRLAGFPFVCVPGIADSEETYRTGETDAFELKVMCRWLEQGDTLVDVGANLGIYSYCASHHLAGNGQVLAIEASPELAANLVRFQPLLGIRQLKVEQVAVGDRSGHVQFFLAPAGKSTGEQSLHPSPERSADYRPCDVPMCTLGEIAAKHFGAAIPAVVKIDIEGAEPLALSAAPPGWFGGTGPLWMIEVNPTALSRASAAPVDITKWFTDEHYCCWLLPQFPKNGARSLPARPLTAGEAYLDAWFYNLIAVPRDPLRAARRARLPKALQRWCV